MRLRATPPAPVLLVLLALALTGLNALKPLHIDDPFIHEVARQIVRAPLDPYGFDILWVQWPQPVSEELTPPVVPYWWALGIVLLGERPLLWKLWLFPFAFLLVAALHSLLRRFAPTTERPVLVLSTLSPAVLPGFNWMQDIPALALALGGLALFLSAVERNSVLRTVGAGALVALALQTKYATVGALGALVLYAVLFRRWRLGAVATSLALFAFLAWEWAMTLRYGKGMFLGQVQQDLWWVPREQMVLPLLRLIGAALPAVGLLGLWGAGLSRRVVLAIAGAVLAGFAILLVWPIEDVWFPVLGAFVVTGVAAAGGRSTRGPEDRRADLFLALWLVGEIAVFFLAAPFPAVRRVLGIVVPATLIAARGAARVVRSPGGLSPLREVAAVGVVLGMLYFAADLSDARAQRQGVERAGEVVHAASADATVWFVGHWGFQYYAERSGMRPVIPDVSRLRRGDWLVVPHPVHQQEIRLVTGDVVEHAVLRLDGFPPLRAGYGYYGGSVPLEHLDGPRLEVRVYRIERDVVLPSAWPPRKLAWWVEHAGGRTAAAALPALVRELGEADAGGRAEVARALAELGPRAAPAVRALSAALDDTEPAVRVWAALALGGIGWPARATAPRLAALAQDPDAGVREAASHALASLRAAAPPT